MSELLKHFPLYSPSSQQNAGRWLSYVTQEGSMSGQSRRAYKLYSLCYAPLALFAYWIVWRGHLIKHIRFFRATLAKSRWIIDIATGDGTLTKKALFPMFQTQAEGLLALDLSESMLVQACKRLPSKKTVLVRADVLDLPFSSGSVQCLTCFGGFNSFQTGKEAMREVGRVLAPNGVVRGSVLLTPKKPWRRRVVDCFIRWGLQTEHVDRDIFAGWIEQAGLKVTECQQNGDVLLFELGRR